MVFQHILVAYDGSELAKTALEKAVFMAKEHPGTKLTVLHVLHFPDVVVGEAYFGALSNLEKEYCENASLLFQDVEKAIEGISGAEVEVRRGYPVESILACAEEKGCDVIVMGSRGLGGLKEFVLGSVSHSVVQQSKVPVFIIKSPSAKGEMSV